MRRSDSEVSYLVTTFIILVSRIEVRRQRKELAANRIDRELASTKILTGSSHLELPAEDKRWTLRSRDRSTNQVNSEVGHEISGLGRGVLHPEFEPQRGRSHLK